MPRIPVFQPLYALQLATCLLAAILAEGCGLIQRLDLNPVESADQQEIALFVNGEPIYRSEVDAMVEDIISNAPKEYPEERIEAKRPEIRAEARRNLIRDQLLDQAIEARQLRPSEQTVERAIAQLDAFLRAQGTSLAAFMRRQQRSPENIRKQVRQRLARNMLIDEMMDIPEPTEAEARLYYAHHKDPYTRPPAAHLHQILLAWPNDAAQTNEAIRTQLSRQAWDLRERILAGARFARLAERYSEGAGAHHGGDVGWVTPERELPSEVLERAFQIELDKLSEPIVSDQGVHVIKVTDRRAGHCPEFEEIRATIDRAIMDERRFAVKDEFYRKLFKDARIVEP